MNSVVLSLRLTGWSNIPGKAPLEFTASRKANKKRWEKRP